MKSFVFSRTHFLEVLTRTLLRPRKEYDRKARRHALTPIRGIREPSLQHEANRLVEIVLSHGTKLGPRMRWQGGLLPAPFSSCSALSSPRNKGLILWRLVCTTDSTGCMRKQRPTEFILRKKKRRKSGEKETGCPIHCSIVAQFSTRWTIHGWTDL